MEVIIVKEENISKGMAHVIDVLNNMRRSDPHVLTGEDIANNEMFEKARAIKKCIEDLLALENVTESNLNNISQELFDKYVEMGNRIGICFDNLMEDCISSRCTDCANECECDNVEDDPCDYCAEREMAADMLQMVNMMKPAFVAEDIASNEHVVLAMTTDEYHIIKGILDKYDGDEETEHNECAEE